MEGIISMFDQFLAEGSVLAVLLMAYAANVMIEVLRIQHQDPAGIYTPRILRSSLGSIMTFGAIPCAFWPAIYIGLFSGILAAIISWLVLQVLGAWITIRLGLRGPLLGFHFIVACIAYPVGYFLSYSTLQTPQSTTITEPEYKTPEFSGSDSTIPTVFMCMFLGKQTGIEPNATQIAMDMMLDTGATPEQVDLWAQDAMLYINHVLPNTNLERVWHLECDAPFSKLKTLYGSN